MNCLRNPNISISSLSQLFVTYKSTQSCIINSIVISGLRNFHYGNSNSLITAEYYINGRFNLKKLSPQVSTIVNIRMTGFYNKWPAERLWKGLTGVSNAGRKKGRVSGKKRKRAKNLNYGQHLGDGEINMVWPGLNAPILKGKSIVQQQELPSKNEERLQRLTEIRDRMGVFKFNKLSPLERGWSGTKMPGRSIGPPEPVGEDKFEGFDTIVLEHKAVTKMDGRLGRKRRLSMLAVTGNKNGLAGFAMAKSGGSALDVARICKNKAAKRLVYIERCDNHTVFHDFYCNYLETKIFVQRKPEGFGLHCHPAIREICRIVGIKDLYAKVEGSTNVQKITKAFFLGLLNQQTHQKLADEKALYVVRLRPGDCARVVAQPEAKVVRSRHEIKIDEELDFKLYTMGGRVALPRKKYEPFYTRLPSYERFLKKEVKRRNHEKIKFQQRLEYGSVISFLTEKHPEADPLKQIVIEDEF